MVRLPADNVAVSLTRREREVLALASEGKTNAEVAAGLGVTAHAIKFHLAAIYRKLGVANRTEAAALYVRGEASVHKSRG